MRSFTYLDGYSRMLAAMAADHMSGMTRLQRSDSFDEAHGASLLGVREASETHTLA